MKRIPATMEGVNKWDDIPLVKLGKILEQMMWFSGAYILNCTKFDYENNGWSIHSASLDIQYRKHQITIKCIWQTERTPYHSEQEYPDRFAIGITEPYHRDFQIQRYRVDNKIKYSYTRYYSAVIDRIEDAIYNAQGVIDREIEEGNAERQKIITAKEIKKRLCKNLDVKIGCEEDFQEFQYREDKEYHLYFKSSNSDSKFFKINQIGGEYTEAEIKKIIEIVGGNPRAIAERLSK